MAKLDQERRKYLRIESPLKIRVISKSSVIRRAATKDISPLGLRFETDQKDIKINDPLELKIEMPGSLCPVHANAKVIWKKKVSTEDNAPFDIGCEFTKVEEDNKNTFLKYFCDLLYSHSKESGEKGE